MEARFFDRKENAQKSCVLWRTTPSATVNPYLPMQSSPHPTSPSFVPPAALPVAIIGAGPVGLAAAAHLRERGLEFLILEAGEAVGNSLRDWAHVRLFSPWEYNIDAAAARLLRAEGWEPPPAAEYPTGGDIVTRYLEPLGRTAALASRLKLRARVVGVSRQGRDRMKSDAGRPAAPFRVRYLVPSGEEEILARAVIDTSGTWQSPNPLGAEGLPARGERALAAVIRYGIPDVLGKERARYAGRRVLVAGSGHSAFNVLVDLVKLMDQDPATAVTWVIRRDRAESVFGGGERDKLVERGALGLTVRRLLAAGRLSLLTSFRTDAVEQRADGIHVRAGERTAGPVDEIIVASGFRPDFSALTELQLGLDPIVGTTPALAPLIDPNLHSCGTVRPHGHAELAHPESGFYLAGMKSYGRAPTFLMRTGYEQVRSIAAALAGDLEAANRVELVLPETGVCSLTRGHAGDDEAAGDEGCCGGAPESDASACCKKDETAKAAGEPGCGCGSGARQPAVAPAGACCE